MPAGPKSAPSAGVALERLYRDKAEGYHGEIRRDLLRLIPTDRRGGRLLDVGAGEGNTLLYAAEQGLARQLHGIDLEQIPGSNQQNPGISDFLIGNIETMDLPFPEGYFDVILCGDVFEHLVDPYAVVPRLARLLIPGGALVASIPNARYWVLLYQVLVKGDFRYQDSGILDRAHLRWFCRKNIVELLDVEDLELERIVSMAEQARRRSRYLNRLTLRLFEPFMSERYYVVARRRPAEPRPEG